MVLERYRRAWLRGSFFLAREIRKGGQVGVEMVEGWFASI